MPFDGSKFFVKPSVFTRMKSFFFKEPIKPEPIIDIPEDDPIIAETMQLLLISRKLIEDKKNWSQGNYRTSDGRMCAVGAMRKAADSRTYSPTAQSSELFARQAMVIVSANYGFDSIESMNDRSNHRFVVKAFDEAIEKVSKEI